MTLEGFDEWDKENKSNYPVRFFLQETVPEKVSNVFNTLIGTPFDNIRWGITYRLFKKHQYQIIRPRTLKPGYYDEETRILHAVMECLVEHVEVNTEYMDYEHPPEELEYTYVTMRYVYEWWTKDYPNRDKFTVDGKRLTPYPKLPKEWGDMAVLRKEYDDEPLMVEWNRVARRDMENRQDWFDKEQEMLMKVIKIRKNLWD